MIGIEKQKRLLDHEIEAEKDRLRESAFRALSHVRKGIDPAVWVDAKPLVTLTVALAVGFWIGNALSGPGRPSSSSRIP